MHVSAGAASAASAPRRTPSASAQASAGDAAEPAPALFPLLRAVRLRVLGVDHGLEAVSFRGVRVGTARRERRVSARRNEAAETKTRARSGDGARAGTHNAAMRFTTLQKMSVTMLSLYGERRLTTAPSRTYGMAPRVSTAPRASNSDDDAANPSGQVRCPLHVGVSEQSPRRETETVRDELLRRARGAPEDAPAEVAPALRRAKPPRSPCCTACGSRRPTRSTRTSALVHDIQQRLAPWRARPPSASRSGWASCTPRLQRDVEEAPQRLRAPAARTCLSARPAPFDRAPDDGLCAICPGRGAIPRRRRLGDAAEEKTNASSSSKTLFDAETMTKTKTKTKTNENDDQRRRERRLDDVVRRNSRRELGGDGASRFAPARERRGRAA